MTLTFPLPSTSNNHMDLWFGVPCSSRILHTLNPRLFPEQLVYIVNHGEDEVRRGGQVVLPIVGYVARD